MNFENFASQNKLLVNFDTFEKPPAKYKQVSRLTVRKGEMVKKTVTKTKCSQLNIRDFTLQIELFPCLLAMKTKDDFEQEKGQKIEKYFWEEKEALLLKMEKNALKNHPRPYLYHQILMSRPKIFNINHKNDFKHQNKTLLKSNTKDIVLSGA